MKTYLLRASQGLQLNPFLWGSQTIWKEFGVPCGAVSDSIAKMAKFNSVMQSDQIHTAEESGKAPLGGVSSMLLISQKPTGKMEGEVEW